MPDYWQATYVHDNLPLEAQDWGFLHTKIVWAEPCVLLWGAVSGSDTVYLVLYPGRILVVAGSGKECSKVGGMSTNCAWHPHQCGEKL